MDLIQILIFVGIGVVGGIIGGMGPAATDLLYRRIVARTEAECDQEHMDMIILKMAITEFLCIIKLTL